MSTYPGPNATQNATAGSPNATGASNNSTLPPDVNAPPGFPGIPPYRTPVGNRRSPKREHFNPEDEMSYYDPPLFPSNVGLRELFQRSAPVVGARSPTHPAPFRRHSAPRNQSRMKWVESKPALPHVPAEPGHFNPYRYVFKVEHRYINLSIENMEVRCPPYHILIDHTIGVLWCIHNKDELPFSWTIGLTQLYWALRFLELLELEDESYPRDIAAAIKQIHIEILDLLDLAYTNWAEIAEHYPPDLERMRSAKYGSFDISGQPLAASSKNPIIEDAEGPIAASTPVRGSGVPRGSAIDESHISHHLEDIEEEVTPALPPINDRTEVRPAINNQTQPRPGMPNETYGAPGTANQTYGTPGIGNQTYGTPGIGNQTYGTPGGANQTYGTPGIANQTYGTPGGANKTYGTPGIANQTYGAPGIANQTRPGVANLTLSFGSPMTDQTISLLLGNSPLFSPEVEEQADEMPFSVNYVDMMLRAPVPEESQVLTPYQVKEAEALEKEDRVNKELDVVLADILNNQLSPYYHELRKNQMQKVVYEVDKLHNIEEQLKSFAESVPEFIPFPEDRDRNLSIMLQEKIRAVLKPKH